MADQRSYKQTFFRDQGDEAADTTETLPADALVHAQGAKMYRLDLSNDDGAINILFRFRLSHDQQVLGPNESITLENLRFDSLFLEAASGTPSYRAFMYTA